MDALDTSSPRANSVASSRLYILSVGLRGLRDTFPTASGTGLNPFCGRKSFGKTSIIFALLLKIALLT